MNITMKRETVQAALEAINNSQWEAGNPDLIKSLTEALAQPTPLITLEASLRFNLEHYKDKCDALEDEIREMKGKAQPSCDCKNKAQCWEPCGDLGHDMEHAVLMRSEPLFGELIAKHDGLAEELAQPEQEPYRWLYDGDLYRVEQLDLNDTVLPNQIPLYIHPTPLVKELSDEEIQNIVLSIHGRPPTSYQIARAIEAHLKGMK